MNFISSILKPFGGIFGNSYESAQRSDDRREPPLVFADARDELGSFDRVKIISKTRYLARNFGLAREIVNTLEIYAVGDGIFPQAASADAAWNKAAEAEFARLFAFPEISRRFSGGKTTRMVCRALDTDGEIFFVKTNADGRPTLQIFEAHRVSRHCDAEQKIYDGIEFDAFGRPRAYYFLDDGGSEERVEAGSVIHVFAAERPSDAHGVPQLQHSVNALIDSKELFGIEKKGVKTINEMAFAIKSAKNDMGATSGDFVFGNETQPDGGTDPDALKRQIGGGKIGKLSPGDELQTISADRPTTTFLGLMDGVNREASLGNVPFEFVGDASKIGGAAVRLVVGRADRIFSRRQQELIEQFLTPVWKFFIGAAIKDGRLAAVEDWDKAEWACPRRVTVDAGREAAQEREDMRAGLISKADLFAARGMRYDVELRRIAAEKAAERAAEQEFGLEPGALSGNGQRATDNG